MYKDIRFKKCWRKDSHKLTYAEDWNARSRPPNKRKERLKYKIVVCNRSDKIVKYLDKS